MNIEQERLFDKVLSAVGDDGLYQKLLFWGFMAPYSVLLPYSALTQFFQISTPQHWCHVPGKPPYMSLELWKNLTIPWEEKEDGSQIQSKCTQFLNIASHLTVNASSSKDSYSTFNQIPDSNLTSECQNGWEYDQTSYDSTLSTEQNWVCDRASYSATYITVITIGNLIGTLIFTYMGDQIGRKPTMILCTVMHIVFCIGRLYLTQSLWIIYLLAFLSGTSFSYILQITCVVVYEQVTSKWRERIVGVSFNCWVTGSCTLPLIAYLSRSWKILGIVTAVPFILMLVIFYFIHETPQWLTSKGKTEKAREVLQSIAKQNKKEWSKEIDENLAKLSVQKGNFGQMSFVELLRHKTLRKRTLLLSYACITNALIYYGLVYNIHNLSGNEFLNFFFLAVVEYPGNIMGWAFAKYFGRRWTQTMAFAMASLCLLIVLLIPDDARLAIIILLILCKMMICISFAVIYMQYVEMFPTSHRASGIGFVVSCTTVAAFSISYIAYSAKIFPKFPYVILLCIGSLGVIAASCLPETKGIPLPQTISEGENSVRGQKFWSYYGWRPKFLISK